jgi:hypothetical protein
MFDNLSSSKYKDMKRKCLEPPGEYRRHEYLRHFEGPAPQDGYTTIQESNGLMHTKFGKGFQRREQKNITIIKNELSPEQKRAAQQRKEQCAVIRRQSLHEAGYKAGYNIISGEPRCRGPSPSRTGGLKYIDDRVAYAESRHADGLTILKNTEGRFHSLTPFGPPPLDTHDTHRTIFG